MEELEVWKDIPGYVGTYQASNLGRIRRLRKAHVFVLRPYPTGARGDRKVDLGGVPRKTHYVSRLVLSAFIGPDVIHQANHKNGDFLDNRLENLEWVTGSENLLHSYRELGRIHIGCKGERNGNAKLTDDLVRNYRALRLKGMAIRAIARLSGLDRRTIQQMLRGVGWSHVS